MLSKIGKNKRKILLTHRDLLISKKVKIRRKLLGIPQHEVAREIKVSVQQIQKYESGKNRISAGKLFSIANFLKTPIEYFFNDKILIENPVYLVAEENENFIDETGYRDTNIFKNNDIFELIKIEKLTDEVQKEIIVLIKEYLIIEDHAIRKTIIELVKNINNH